MASPNDNLFLTVSCVNRIINNAYMAFTNYDVTELFDYQLLCFVASYPGLCCCSQEHKALSLYKYL